MKFVRLALAGLTLFLYTQTLAQANDSSAYQLYPTQNYWTFIKLDTRNGKMWQIHFSIKENENRGQLILNSSPLVFTTDEIKGRFALYPTQNMYNFLLLDKISGDLWQVQWSMDIKNRGIIGKIE